MTRQGTRVGTYLLWLVLAVSVPLLLFACGTLWRIQSAQHQQQETMLVEQARDAAVPADRVFERLQNGLLSLASSSALEQGNLDSFMHEMQGLSGRLGNIRLSLATPDGTIVREVDHLTPGGSPQQLQQIRQGVRDALQAGGPIVTNLLPANDPADRAVVVAVPAYRPGQSAPAYILTGSLKGRRLADLAKPPLSYAQGLVITVHDRQGVTVACSQQGDQSSGDTVPPGLQQAIAGRRLGLLNDATLLNGQPAIRAFSIASVSGYIVVAAIPQTAVTARIQRDLVQLFIIGAALLLLGLLAATYLARRLVTALHAVERDDPAIAASGLREVDELAARLRNLSLQRETAQAALHEREIRLQDLVGTLDLAPIMTCGMDGTIRFWSYGCVQMYGWTAKEAIGQCYHALLRPQFPVPQAEIKQALEAGGEWNGDLIHRRRDGSLIVVAAHRALKRDDSGQPHIVMESLVDVTALREAQDALKTINQGLEQRVREEIAARELAQQRTMHADRIQALGQLAGGIAHDFNNVLQAIAGGAALIARRPQDAEAVARLIQLVGDAAARGASITRRMLVLARRGDLRAEPVEVTSLLDTMREVFMHVLGPTLDVVVEAAAGLPRLLADMAQLETALVNLATNARDAMPGHGVLRLTAGLEVVKPNEREHPAGLLPGAYIRLSMVDTGAGMTGATLARAGEPFFTTKDVGKGTGLGLSMVKGFAEQSNGGFVISSKVGLGTRATLWLPAVPDEFGDPAAKGTTDNSRLRMTGRILLVDDDQLVRDTLMEQLEELGHKVLSASGGTDALGILRAREAVDLMITDLAMPGMDGLMLIREARDLRPSLPTILLTGYAGDAEALENSDVARDTYTLLRKPATSAMLNARVKELLER